MRPGTHLAPHRLRTAELRAEADAYRRAARVRRRRDLRGRLGWTLVAAGLRPAVTPRTAVAVPRAL
ncbi:hypothetical protein AB0E75_02595 [Streptomyces griseoviridis]|uniref:Uncharacterized protein n=2 Tax=Streptomyces TaxID=1883 RepID=A0A918GA54_STRGD|nr:MULTISPECIES: hypothetical protein [Streptomyces]GGS25609.1 hypothetical protein GCM10010238_12390 [Streptomyces niveoruber]GGU41197.1 hypothetical protein GCM10010259_35160 [Streptomyces daghestanicus]GHI31245.1 hypothetical protein Sdagh_29750 [Streptomyces daghestanicus]